MNSTLEIKILESAAEYPLWVVRMKGHLCTGSLWDTEKDSPLETIKAAAAIIAGLSNGTLQLVVDKADSATGLWTALHEAFITIDLSAKSEVLAALVNFQHRATILESRAALLALRTRLIAAFSGKNYIPVDDLIAFFAVVKLPPSYHPLRSALEKNSKQ